MGPPTEIQCKVNVAMRNLRRKKMNWEIIASNLGEAMRSIENILENLGHPDLTGMRYKIEVEHILHHILIAWNARHASDEQYAEMSDENFVSWSTMHNDLHPLGSDFPVGNTLPKRSGKFDRGHAKRYLKRHWTKSDREFTWAMRQHRKKKCREEK